MARQLPDSWIFSDKLIKRAFGVLGHNILAVLMIEATILILMALFALISLLF